MQPGSASPRPQGQGLAAASRRKRAGSVRREPPRQIATSPASRAVPSASRASRRNSGSSSRKRTPWWAIVASPGRVGVPPPSRPAALIVWWGARKGRAVQPAPRRPVALAMRAISSASARSGGGRIEGRRTAARDLPEPGGPTIKQAVAAGGGDLEGEAQRRLAAQLGEVGGVGALGVEAERRRGGRPLAGGEVGQLAEVVERDDLDPGREGCLGGVGGGQDDRLRPALAVRPRRSAGRRSGAGSSRRGRARRRRRGARRRASAAGRRRAAGRSRSAGRRRASRGAGWPAPG